MLKDLPDSVKKADEIIVTKIPVINYCGVKYIAVLTDNFKNVFGNKRSFFSCARVDGEQLLEVFLEHPDQRGEAVQDQRIQVLEPVDEARVVARVSIPPRIGSDACNAPSAFPHQRPVPLPAR